MPTKYKSYYIFLSLIFFGLLASAQNLDDFKYSGPGKHVENPVTNDFQFNGYTNHWHDTYSTWYRYGNLYKMAVPNVEKTILQSKVDIAEDMGIPGFTMCEGFLSGLLSTSYTILNQPGQGELDAALAKGNVLVFVDPGSVIGKKLIPRFPDTGEFVKELKSHQYEAVDLKRAHACSLENGEQKLFIVSSTDAGMRRKIGELIEQTAEILDAFDLHKGWFGAYTLLNSVTCTPGHPLDVIARGMNEGNDWFVFSGYMDFLSKNELEEWVKSVNIPVVTDVGFSPIFGCKDYDGLQVQDMVTKDSWIKYAHQKGGYAFRHVWDTLADPYHYDGYIALEGNKEQIDEEDVPFVLSTGRLLNENALSSMVLFVPKGTPFTNEIMWEAILDRREVGVFEKGKMTGPANFRNALEMLLLDRVYIESYFGDRLNLETEMTGYTLQVHLTNTLDKAITGDLNMVLPEGLKISGEQTQQVSLPARSQKTIDLQIQPSSVAMGRTNAISVQFKWKGKEKRTLAMLDLPPAISVHHLLYGHAPKVIYPVAVHNFTSKTSFPVQVNVIDIQSGKTVFKAKQTFKAPTASFDEKAFELEVPAGSYKVHVSALGINYESQLGVGAAKGSPYLYAVDLNSDGVDEYHMENDSIQITLLATGARVIEYKIKSRDDNVLYKKWPKKPIDDKRPFRKRGYYPYGGFEDFLGQASMETHKVYDVEVIREKGDYVRLKMTTDYFGNKLEKIYTLYGNSPLLEVRFAMTFKNPETNILAPVPVLVLGKKHWTEDVYTVPEKGGLEEFRMDPDRYYGHYSFSLEEGWDAGYDTKEDITFVGAFPVDQPLFLHMFMNHPRNPDAHFYCNEFQPWLRIYQKTTTYFTYYLWGAGGPWENGVQELREMNLITTQ